MADTRAALERQVLQKLRGQAGISWREVQGELQERQGECAIWILLFEDSDPKQSHAVFCEVVTPFMQAMAPVQFTVSYIVLTDRLDMSVETCMSNAEILSALEDERFGKTPTSRSRQAFSVFEAGVSGRRPG